MQIAVGTRFFEKDPIKVERVVYFVRKAREIAPNVLVAVNVDADRTDAVNAVNSLGLEGISAFPVTPWGKFVMPLNALIIKACEAGASHLLLASVEVADSLTKENVEQLSAPMTNGILVVGAAMEGHNVKSSQGKDLSVADADGCSIPWNTLALWNLKYLQRFGFPLIGDALFDPKQAGVEEVSAIALYQKVYPELQALLMVLPGMKWDTADLDEERRKKHEAKMASKVSRPAAQMAKLGIKHPFVRHLSPA